MIETEKILPCPHCGGPAKIMRDRSTRRDVGYICVRCIVCGASGKTARVGVGLTPDEGSAILEATLAWNLRIPMQTTNDGPREKEPTDGGRRTNEQH